MRLAKTTNSGVLSVYQKMEGWKTSDKTPGFDVALEIVKKGEFIKLNNLAGITYDNDTKSFVLQIFKDGDRNNVAQSVTFTVQDDGSVVSSI